MADLKKEMRTSKGFKASRLRMDIFFLKKQRLLLIDCLCALDVQYEPPDEEELVLSYRMEEPSPDVPERVSDW